LHCAIFLPSTNTLTVASCNLRSFLYRALAHIISDTPMVAVLNDAKKVSLRIFNSLHMSDPIVLFFCQNLVSIFLIDLLLLHTLSSLANFAAYTSSTGLFLHVDRRYPGQRYAVWSVASLILYID